MYKGGLMKQYHIKNVVYDKPKESKAEKVFFYLLVILVFIVIIRVVYFPGKVPFVDGE
jgi:cell division protein FtsL